MKSQYQKDLEFESLAVKSREANLQSFSKEFNIPVELITEEMIRLYCSNWINLQAMVYRAKRETENK